MFKKQKCTTCKFNVTRFNECGTCKQQWKAFWAGKTNVSPLMRAIEVEKQTTQ